MMAQSAILPRQGMPPDFSPIIRAIGEATFGGELLAFLHRLCGAEHCAIFDCKADRPRELIAVSFDGSNMAHRRASQYIAKDLWRNDTALEDARGNMQNAVPYMKRVDVRTMPRGDLRHSIYESGHIRERLLLCGGGGQGLTVLSILRSERRGRFSDSETLELFSVARNLLAIVEKQNEIAWRRGTLKSALSSLETIQGCIIAAPEQLPRRETEVCARIIYGLSTIGIALDLGIGEQTVTTYRKRAYQRLGICSQRELLTWYMARWNLDTVIH